MENMRCKKSGVEPALLSAQVKTHSSMQLFTSLDHVQYNTYSVREVFRTGISEKRYPNGQYTQSKCLTYISMVENNYPHNLI